MGYASAAATISLLVCAVLLAAYAGLIGRVRRIEQAVWPQDAGPTTSLATNTVAPDADARPSVQFFVEHMCAACLAIQPAIERLARNHPDVRFVVHWTEARPRSVQPSPYVQHEEDQVELASDLGVPLMPFAVFVDPSGNIQSSGVATSEDAIANRLTSIVSKEESV